MTNMIMGPPIFAPLLFGISAYLGVIASYLRREDAGVLEGVSDRWRRRIASGHMGRESISRKQDIREGKFQRQVAIVTGVSALLSGFEAFYSHYKNNFRYVAQWTPIVIAPLLAGTAFASTKSRKLATTALPALSVVAAADSAVGFYYHARGVLRRPGGQSACFTTSCTVHRSLRRCCLALRECSVFWQACCAGAVRDRRLHSPRNPRKGESLMDENESIVTGLLPRNPANGEPLPQTRHPGYYPGYSVLSQQRFWDEATRGVIQKRVEQPPPIRYFTAEQATFWRAVFDHLLPQDDRTPDRRIPLVEPLDERLYRGQTIGYRYESMPNDPEAFALGEQAINAEARHRYAGTFLDLSHYQRDLVLKALHDQKCEAAPEIWARMSIARFWQMLMQDAVEGYYAHPWSWDEIGFGGPAYPRAYTRLERGEPEPWEVEEQRYAWDAPSDAVSDETVSTHHQHTEAMQNG